MIKSSYEVSSEDDEDSEDEEFVTLNEFLDYKNEIKAEFDEVKTAYRKAEKESTQLIEKIDQVDWTVIN